MKLKRVKGAGQRWKKGHSCVSNPENTKFRSAARGNFFQKLEGESSLTVEALAKHTASLAVEPKLRADPEDDKSIGKSFNTFATNFTTCTIPAFHNFFKNFTVDSDLQTRMLAIHAAAQEYIQDARIPETATSYTCSLMVSLEGIKESEEDVCATLSLLAKVIRKVSKDVLRAKFSEYSKLFDEILTTYSSTQNLKLVINIIGCLSILLRAQDEIQWTYPYTSDLFHRIVAYTTHENDDVRRSAQYNVSAVLRASSFMVPPETPNEDGDEEMQVDATQSTSVSSVTMTAEIGRRRCHPASQSVGEFILTNLKLASEQMNGKATLYLLLFLQQIIVGLPEKLLEKCCGRVLGVMHIGDTVMNARALKVFGALFTVDRTPSGVSALSEDTHEAILNALSSSQDDANATTNLRIVPGVNHADLALVWMEVVAAGVVGFVKLNESRGIEWFSRWMKLLTSFWKSEAESVREKVWHTIDLIFDDCIKPLKEKSSSYANQLLASLHQVQKYLSLQFKPAWPFVFNSLCPFFCVLGKDISASTHIVSCLKNLSQMVDVSDLKGEKELERAIGSAIKFVGPEKILNVIPIQVTGDIKVDELHYWILPILKRHIVDPRLCFFTQYFLPLTQRCHEVIKKLRERGDGDSLLIKTYQQIEWQIWALLPAFTKGATDVNEALSVASFAKLLCDHIRQREDTRINILAALRNMLSSSEASRKLCQYADKYFKALVNIYLLSPRNKQSSNKDSPSVDAGQRIAAFATIQCYMPIISPAQRREFFNLVVESFDKEDDLFRRKTFISLTRPFIPFLETHLVDKIYQKAVKELESPKSNVQKIAYRIIEDILVSESESCRSFTLEKLGEMFNLFIKASVSVIPSAKSARLGCLRRLLTFVESDLQARNIGLSWNILVEESIKNCGGANSAPCRKAAFALLTAVGETVRRVNQLSDEETFRRCFSLLPRLDPNSDLTANTVLALMALIYRNKEIVPLDLIGRTTRDVSGLLSGADRGIVKSALSFVRMVFVLCPVPNMSDHADVVVRNIVRIPLDQRKKFRDKIRDILASFARKFGADRIRILIPEDDMLRRVLANVVKKDARHKRSRKNSHGDADDEADEDEEEVDATNSLNKILDEIDHEIDSDEKKKKNKDVEAKKKLTKKQAWIKEEEGEVLDLLDFSSGQNICSTKPKLKKLRFQEDDEEQSHRKTDEEKYGFKKDKKTNKFIITNDGPDADDDDDDDDDYMSLLDPIKELVGKSEAKMTSSRGGKRKRKVSENSEDSQVPPQKMRTAGSSAVSVAGSVRSARKFNYGAEFRSKKAGGDVTKKGGVTPYAYVQFSKDKLNRRKKAKYVGQFKSLVRGAKRGAVKGAKNKVKKR